MRKYIPYLVVFLLGIVTCSLCRKHHFRVATKMVQSDTVVVYDTIRYSRLDLSSKIVTPHIPKGVMPDLIYVPSDSTTIIYRDNVKYVTLPRQYYFTETEDVQIWHSGVDSSIDSLNVFQKTTNITQVYQPKWKKNSISIGIEASRANTFAFPLQIEYARRIKPWFSIYGYAEYELQTKQIGVGIGASIGIEW